MIVLEILIFGVLTACEGGSDKPKVVVCVPVYGQSLAMGEESELVTDIDGLTKKWNGRLVGEGLDEFISLIQKKLWAINMVHLHRFHSV